MDDDEIIVNIKMNNNKNSKSSTKKKSKKINKKKESKNKKSLKILKTLAIIIVLAFLILLILSSSLFNINAIQVEGNNNLSNEKIISLSSIELYTNIFNFSVIKTKQKIKENPYIEDVKITRKLPSSILITVEERVPTYMLQFADSYVYINNQGYMLEISNEKLNIPIITGFTTDLSNIKAGNRINSEDLKKMNMVIKIYQALNNNGIAEIVSKIDMSDDRNYTLFFDSEGKKVYLGDCVDLSTRILVLKSILEASLGKTGEIFLNVDLNTERPYFRESI